MSSAEDMSPIPVAPPSEHSEPPPPEHPIELEEVAANEPATPPPPPIKSNMVAHPVRLTISGTGPAYFSEETTSVLVFDNGGVLLISSAVVPGQLLLLTNVESKTSVVAQIKRKRADRPTLCYIELEFVEPFPRFWGMEFSAASALLPKASKDVEAAALLLASEATSDEPGRPLVAPTTGQISAFKQELESLRNAALSALPPISMENPFGDAQASVPSETAPQTEAPAVPAPDQAPPLPKFSLTPLEASSAEQIQAQLNKAQEQRAAAQEELAPAHEELVPAHEQASEPHAAIKDPSFPEDSPAPQPPTESIDSIPVAAPKQHVNWHEAPLPEPNPQVNWHEVSKAANTPGPAGTDRTPEKLRSSQDAMLDLLHSHAQESQSQPPDVTVSLPNLKKMRRPRGNFTPGFIGAVLRIVLAVAAILFVVVGAAWFKHWLPWNSASTVVPRGSLANVSAKPKAPQTAGSSAAANSSTEITSTKVASDAPVTSAGTTPTIVAPVQQADTPAQSSVNNPEVQVSEPVITASQPTTKKPAVVTVAKNSVVPAKTSVTTPPRVAQASDPDVVPPKLVKSVRAVASLETLHDFETGNVVIDAVVGTSGEVNFISVLSGPPSLREPAIASLKEYLYEPATRHGQPVPVHVTITIHFRFEP